ncbi:hypothetical protein DSM106972_049650 [Dulcicalothrix desertica PCC 7102]|uniref:Uncharacterized protein n=1 Tax=Dulcicalothrix desertica PCC 7102 TaxID=232991 RepID=A0A433VD61_9CYAN|nr:hypothetical protein [Dulcicalothrix desertica]RUT04051.1 hypothetical protein DSM106972_049650 [Dulcicalothrix desertica PCC 7102]TWH43547.1 hypothetical protein CAL7102_07280 [Dulcicalothrix desertica PCC 7102]
MSAKPKQQTVRFEMLLTKEQNDSLVQQADSLGISKAELIRRRIAKSRIKSIPQVNWQCYWQLLKIAEDIKCIAQTQNNAMDNGSIPQAIDPIMIEELMIQISQIRLHLILGAKSATGQSSSEGVLPPTDFAECPRGELGANASNIQQEENDDWEG